MSVFTAVYSGSYDSSGATTPVTATNYFVFPPGFDCYLPAMTPVSVDKTGYPFAWAIGQVLFIDGNNTITGDSTRYVARVIAAAASAAGDPTASVYLLPHSRELSARASYTGDTRPDILSKGVAGESVCTPSVSPISFSSATVGEIFAGMDPMGSISYYTTGAAAQAAKQISWMVGRNLTQGSDPITNQMYLRRLMEVDGQIIGSLVGQYGDNSPVKTVQGTISPGTISPGSPLYSNPARTQFTASSLLAANPIYLGICVYYDRSVSPPIIKYLPPVWSSIRNQSNGVQQLARVIPYPMYSTQNRFLGILDIPGDATRMHYQPDFGAVPYIGLARHVSAWDYSSVWPHVPTGFPSVLSQVVAPLLEGVPDFAIDCTLPAPWGACRITWLSGFPHLFQQTDPATPPAGMERKNVQRGILARTCGRAATGNDNLAFIVTYNLSGWADHPYPLSAWPGPYSAGNPAPSYAPLFGGFIGSGEGLITGCRLEDIPDIRIHQKWRVFTGATSLVVKVWWVRLDATIPDPYEAVCSAEVSLTAVNTGVAFDGISELADVNDTITLRPTGSSTDIGVWALRVRITYNVGGSPVPEASQIGTICLIPPPRNFYIDNYRLKGESSGLNRYGISETGVSTIRKTVCPFDIRLWQPFSNDATCSYVGNSGYGYPTPPQLASFGQSGTFTTTWSSNVLSADAVPGGTVTTLVGSNFVRSTETLLRWGFRAVAPSIGMAYGSMGDIPSYRTLEGSSWIPIENGIPVSSSSRVPPTSTQGIQMYNPGQVPTDILVDQCLMVNYWTSWGFNITHLNDYQRTTLTLP